jgi:hypothetical protein
MSESISNVFADDSGVLPEGGFLRRMTQLQIVQESSRIPDDYGVAWYRWDTAEAICAPMPWHALFRFCYHWYWRWRVVGNPDILTKAYLKGMEDQRIIHDRQRLAVEDDVNIRIAAAYEKGQRDHHAYLESLLDLQREVNHIKEDIHNGEKQG